MNVLNPINKITNQEDKEDVVPPPPPHIELLSVVNETNLNKCIYNVISYLDVNSRQLAFTSCVYLRDAVKEYINNMSVVVAEENTDDTPQVSGGGSKPATLINEQPVDDLIEGETSAGSSEGEEDVSSYVAELPTEEENDTSSHLVVTKCETPPPTLAELSSESEPSSSSSTESSVVSAKDQIDNLEENDIPTLSTPKVPSTPPKKTTTSGDDDQVIDSSTSSTPNKSTKQEDDKSTKLLISPRSVLQEEDCQIIVANNEQFTTPAEYLPEDEALPEEAEDVIDEQGEEKEVEDISLSSTIPSITTIDLQQDQQTETFLSMVSSSGAISLSRTHSHLSVLTSDTGMQQQQQTPDYIPSATETNVSADTEDVSAEENRDEEEKKQEDPSSCKDTELIVELSEMQTVSSTLLQDTPIISPTTPMMNTPDVSVTGAQRLELNTMNHIIRDGNEKEVPPMFGSGIHSSMTTVSLGGIMEQQQCEEREVTGDLAQSSRPQTQQEAHATSFTRLCEMRNTSMEELPFDERPKHLPQVSNSMNSSLSNTMNEEPTTMVKTFEDDISEVTPASTIPNTNNNSESLEGQNSFDTTSTDDYSANENESSTRPASNDVLAQVTDAALFGTSTSVSEVITDMAKSVKSSVNNLVLHKHGRRNQIDDAGPIKIGEKYYSHNEALYLWRKTKIKLKDRHGDIDDAGDVKIEKASFFEKNSIFQEEKADEKKDESTTTSLDMTDDKLMSLGELISHYEIRPLKVDDSSVNTATTGDELKTSRLMPVSEEPKEPAEFRGFDVDNETSETESETNCSAGGVDGSGDDSSMTSEDDDNQSPTADGGVQQHSSWGRTTNTNNCDTDSVAGSLPSHMGSAYGVEVTSLRGTSGNFINGKGSSEQVKLGSVGKGSCEQSVLGSQYGTEVLFKPSKKKKVSTRRKSRTLTRHNMGIKTASISGAKGQSSITTSRQTTKKKSILKLKLGMKKNSI